MVRTDFSLPFSITSAEVSWDDGGRVDTSVYEGLPISGLLRIEEKALCFQFRRTVSVSMTGWMRGERDTQPPEIEDACVPLDQIREGALKRSRWYTSRLTVHANDLRAFEQIPGGMGTRIVLRIAKEHADLAERFISRLHLKLSEDTLRHLDDDLD